jgi:protein-disulfide isomerase
VTTIGMRWQGVVGGLIATTVLGCSTAERPGTEIAAAGTTTAVAATPAAVAVPDPLASRSKGSATAPITIYEMSDFQCPFCRRHAIETFPTLEKEYVETGKVRWVFVNLPITEIHPNALPAAELSICAANAGKFWPVHDLLFQHQAVWAPLREAGPFLLTLADSVGMDRAETLACLQDSTTRKTVEAEAVGAGRAGASSTPTFYIEGGLLVGAQPVEIFRTILDSIHRAKTAR